MARRTLSSNAQTAAAVRSSPVRGLVVGAGAVLCGVLAARLGYSRFLDAPGSRRAPGRDTSRATVLLDTGGAKAPQPITPSRLGSSQQPQQQRRRALQEVDAEQFATFVAEQRVVLHGAQLRTRAAAAATLHEELQTAVSGPRARVTNFADWYFSYPNTYKLLGVAMSSAAKHAVAFRTEQTLSAAVSADLQEHVGRKYEAIVLRPALLDPMLHRAFVHSLQSAHDGYRDALMSLDGSVAEFVSQQSEVFASAPQPSAVVLSLDYATQLQKVEHVPIEYEKNPELTLALVGTGMAVGKAVGGVAVSGAAKALAAKMVAPFATKAATATLSGACVGGAAAGGAAAGPAGAAIGAVAGAAIGLGVDFGVQAGVSLMQRPAFEADVLTALDATAQDWEERLLLELERVEAVWFERAMATLAATAAPHRAAVAEEVS